MPTKLKVIVGLLVCSLAAGIIYQAPIRWTASKAYRTIFPEQNAERPVYDDTANAPVDLATFVRKTRAAWPQEGVVTVHAAALEVATGLLHHSDIEVGSKVNGAFVPWQMSPWTAAQKIRTEIAGMTNFLTDESRYVFRRKRA